MPGRVASVVEHLPRVKRRTTLYPCQRQWPHARDQLHPRQALYLLCPLRSLRVDARKKPTSQVPWEGHVRRGSIGSSAHQARVAPERPCPPRHTLRYGLRSSSASRAWDGSCLPRPQRHRYPISSAPWVVSQEPSSYSWRRANDEGVGALAACTAGELAEGRPADHELALAEFEEAARRCRTRSRQAGLGCGFDVEDWRQDEIELPSSDPVCACSSGEAPSAGDGGDPVLCGACNGLGGSGVSGRDDPPPPLQES